MVGAAIQSIVIENKVIALVLVVSNFFNTLDAEQS